LRNWLLPAHIQERTIDNITFTANVDGAATLKPLVAPPTPLFSILYLAAPAPRIAPLESAPYGAPTRRNCNMRFALGVCTLLALQTSPAKADIWGYVDAERVPHFAASQLDERYELLLKDSNVVEPYRLLTPVGSTQTGSTQATDAGLAAPAADLSRAANILSPKLKLFFDQSRAYKTVSPLILEASQAHGIDYSLLKALITTESGFNTEAVSPKGAVGLMQLIPPTAERYGVRANKDTTIAKKLTDPKTNIKAGARYLADLIKMFPGRLELALAAYNAGEGAVQRAGNKIPNYPETQHYVKTVLQLYSGLTPATGLAVPVRPSTDLKKLGTAQRLKTDVPGEAPGSPAVAIR